MNKNPTKLTTTLTTGGRKTRDVLVLRHSGRLNKVLGRYVRGKFNLRAFRRRLAKPRCTTHFVQVMGRRRVRCQLGAVIVSVDRSGIVATVDHRRKVCRVHTGTIVLTVNYEREPQNTLGVPKCQPTNVCSTKATRHLMGVRKFVPKGGMIVLKSNSVKLVVTEHVALRNTRIGTITRLVPCSKNLGQGVIRYLSSFKVPLGLDRAIISVGKGGHIRKVALTRMSRGEHPVPNARRFFRYSALLLSINLVPRGRLSKRTNIGLDGIASKPIMGRDLRAGMRNIFTYKGILRIRSLISFISRRTNGTKEGTTLCVGGGKRSGVPRRVGVALSPRGKIHCAIPSRVHVNRVTRRRLIHFHIKGICGGYCVHTCLSKRQVFSEGGRITTPKRVRRVGLGGRRLLSVLRKGRGRSGRRLIVRIRR